MELNKENYTPRQVALIEQIGAEYRDRIDKDERNFNIYFWIMQAVLAGAAIGYYIWQRSYLLPLVLAVIVLYDVLSVYKKRRTQFRQMREASDYEVGRFVAAKNPKVKGYAKRKTDSVKHITNMVGIGGLIVGAIFCYSAVTTKTVDKTSLQTVSGTLSSCTAETSYSYNSTSYSISCYKLVITQPGENAGDDPVELEGSYLVYSYYSNLGKNIDALTAALEDASASKSVTISYDTTYFESYGFYNVYDLSMDGTSYLSIDDINASTLKSKQFNLIESIVILALGAAIFAGGYVFKAVAYKKYEANEEIDLSYTEAEAAEVKAVHEEAIEEHKKEVEARKAEAPALSPDEEYAVHHASIKTKPLTKSYIINGVMVAAGIGGILYALLASPSYKILIIVLCAFVLVMGGAGFVDCFTSYEALEGDQIIVKKYFRVQKLEADEIASISFVQGHYSLNSIEEKPILYLNANKSGSDDIVANLFKRGVEDKLHSSAKETAAPSAEATNTPEATDGDDTDDLRALDGADEAAVSEESPSEETSEEEEKSTEEASPEESDTSAEDKTEE